jgi:hypothetical protein
VFSFQEEEEVIRGQRSEVRGQRSEVGGRRSGKRGKCRDGMKSFSNRRWADRKVWFNVPRGTCECLQHARVAEGPKVR